MNLLDFEKEIDPSYIDLLLRLVKQTEDMLGNQPQLNSVEEVQMWLGDFRLIWVQMLPLHGKLSQDMLINQYKFIETLNKDLEKKLKGSSTLLTNLANAKFKYYGLLKHVDNLLKMCLQVSPEINTMLSNYTKQNG